MKVEGASPCAAGSPLSARLSGGSTAWTRNRSFRRAIRRGTGRVVAPFRPVFQPTETPSNKVLGQPNPRLQVPPDRSRACSQRLPLYGARAPLQSEEGDTDCERSPVPRPGTTSTSGELVLIDLDRHRREVEADRASRK